MEEIVVSEKDESGAIIKEVRGVSKIFDPVLLEEIIQYNDNGNFDRIVAAELAIAQAMKMDPIMGRIGGSGDARVLSLYSNKKSNNKLFSQSSSTLFGGNRKQKSKLFI
jgi:hypothetical protein